MDMYWSREVEKMEMEKRNKNSEDNSVLEVIKLRHDGDRKGCRNSDYLFGEGIGGGDCNNGAYVE